MSKSKNDIEAQPANLVLYDDDGDPIPQPAGDSDLAGLIQLMQYCRLKGWRLGPTIQFGRITTTIADLRQRDPRGGTRGDVPEPSIWREHGMEDDPNG